MSATSLVGMTGMLFSEGKQHNLRFGRSPGHARISYSKQLEQND
jgi:hypothetical protein